MSLRENLGNFADVASRQRHALPIVHPRFATSYMPYAVLQWQTNSTPPYTGAQMPSQRTVLGNSYSLCLVIPWGRTPYDEELLNRLSLRCLVKVEINTSSGLRYTEYPAINLAIGGLT